MPELLYPDLDYFTNAAALAFYSDLVTVPVGLGALIGIRLSGAASLVGNFVPTLDDVPGQGLTEGNIRICLNATNINSAADGGGVLCMQSAYNVTTSGNAYGFIWRPIDNSSGFGLSLIKVTGGLAAGVAFLVGMNAPDTFKTLNLKWKMEGGAVLLVGSTGVETDYSDLAPILGYTDSSSPFLTTVSEGGFALATSGTAFRLTYDDMTLLTL